MLNVIDVLAAPPMQGQPLVTDASLAGAQGRNTGWEKGKRGMKQSFYLKSFGRRVRVLREDLGLSQPELVEAVMKQGGVGVTQSYLSKLESGKNRTPGGEIVLALAKALGTTTDFLLGRVNDPEILTEGSTVAISPEAEEVAKIVDALAPDVRQEALHLVQAIYGAEALRRTRNAEKFQQLLNAVERISGRAARQQIEQALITDTLEVVGNRPAN